MQTLISQNKTTECLHSVHVATSLLKSNHTTKYSGAINNVPVITWKDAKQALRVIHSRLSDTYNAINEHYKDSKDLNCYDYACYLYEVIKLIEDDWEDTVCIENHHVSLRLPVQIRTDDLKETVFGQGQLLSRVVASVERFARHNNIKIVRTKETS